MSFSAPQFLEAYFRELAARAIPAVILHGYEKLPAHGDSDLDYAVPPRALARLPEVQRALAAQHGWQLVHVIEPALSASRSVLVQRDDPAQCLQLDACGDFVESGCFVLSSKTLLAAAQPRGFFHVPAPAVEFGYLLGKAACKRRLVALPRLRELWRSDPAGAERMFATLAGEPGATLPQWLERTAAEWEALEATIRQRRRFGPALRLRELARAARRIARPAGLHLAVLGPDGAGKSTLIERCTPPLLKIFRRQRTIHFRPRLGAPASTAPVAEPHAQPSRGRIASVLKVLYYFLDCWAGHILRVWPALVRNELVIFDRTFADMLVDPRRYRLRGGAGWIRLLARLLPQPALTLILDAPADTIHARKPELPRGEIERQLAALRAQAEAAPSHVLIPADAPADAVATSALRVVLDLIASRR